MVGAVLAAAVAACSTAPKPPPLAPRIQGATVIEMPDVLGTPVVVLAPELPQGAVKAGETASFDIAFTIDLRGAVTESRIESTSRPDLADTILAVHKQWIYAVATRAEPCAARRFRGLQTIAVTQREGKLVSAAEPARVVEELETRRSERVDRGTVSVPNYRVAMRSVTYPRAALDQGVEASLAIIVLFSTEGAVVDAFPVNAAYDPWGFAKSAMQASRQLRMEPPPQHAIAVCVPIEFRIR